jgi:hypothetical protein
MYFFLLDDPANELLLSAGLGTHRILAMPLALHAMPTADNVRYIAEQLA